MTLGRPSLLLVSLSLFTGCASGEVAGTGTPNRTFEDSNPSSPSNNGGTGGSGGSSEPAAEEDGPIDYDALFDAPADPTTTDDLVTGLWAGTTYSGEVRLKITASKVVIAMKCGSSPAEGMDVGAVITSSKMKMLASKSIGTLGYCGIKVTPVEIPRCVDDYDYECFSISGTTLKFVGAALFTGGSSSSSSERYTKLSD
jgi:hypothetical protein